MVSLCFSAGELIHLSNQEFFINIGLMNSTRIDKIAVRRD